MVVTEKISVSEYYTICGRIPEEGRFFQYFNCQAAEDSLKGGNLILVFNNEQDRMFFNLYR